MKIEEYEKMKEEIERRKTKKAEAEGQLKQLNKTLKDKYGFDSVKDADKAVGEMEKEEEELKTELDEHCEKMRTEYDLQV